MAYPITLFGKKNISEISEAFKRIQIKYSFCVREIEKRERENKSRILR